MRPSYHLFAIFLLFTLFVSGQGLLASSYSITTTEPVSLPSAGIKATDLLSPRSAGNETTDLLSLPSAVIETIDLLSPRLADIEATNFPSLPFAGIETTDNLTPLPPVTMTTDSASLQRPFTRMTDTIPHLSAADTTTDSSLFRSPTSGSLAQNGSPHHEPWLCFKRVLPKWDLWRVRNSNVNSSIDEDGGGSRIIGLTPGGIVIRTMITYNPPIWPLYLLLREIIRVPSFRHHHSHLTT